MAVKHSLRAVVLELAGVAVKVGVVMVAAYGLLSALGEPRLGVHPGVRLPIVILAAYIICAESRLSLARLEVRASCSRLQQRVALALGFVALVGGLAFASTIPWRRGNVASDLARLSGSLEPGVRVVYTDSRLGSGQRGVRLALTSEMEARRRDVSELLPITDLAVIEHGALTGIQVQKMDAASHVADGSGGVRLIEVAVGAEGARVVSVRYYDQSGGILQECRVPADLDQGLDSLQAMVRSVYARSYEQSACGASGLEFTDLLSATADDALLGAYSNESGRIVESIRNLSSRVGERGQSALLRAELANAIAKAINRGWQAELVAGLEVPSVYVAHEPEGFNGAQHLGWAHTLAVGAVEESPDLWMAWKALGFVYQAAAGAYKYSSKSADGHEPRECQFLERIFRDAEGLGLEVSRDASLERALLQLSEQSYSRATTVRPAAFYAWSNLLSVRSALHDYDKAEEAYTEATGIYDGSAAPYINMAATLLVRYRESAKGGHQRDAFLGRAEDLLGNARSLDSSNGHVYYNLACVYSHQGRFNDALDSLRKATRLDDRNYAPLIERDLDLEALRRARPGEVNIIVGIETESHGGPANGSGDASGMMGSINS